MNKHPAYPRTVHVSWAGPERRLTCAGRVWIFEDHAHCGPIVLAGKGHDPAPEQPPEDSPFWDHVNAWCQQGKQVKQVGNIAWCVYEVP